MTDVNLEAPNPQPNLAALNASASEKFHIELQKTVTVFGVTNRHLSNDGRSFEDGGLEVKSDNETHYYKETVPVVGKKGDFKATGPGKIEVIDKAAFDKETAAAVKNSGNKLGIYIHGIRNAIGEPGQKAAELSADSGETFVVEDWASTAEIKTKSKMGNVSNLLTQQRVDYQSSTQSQDMINKSAEELIDKFGADNVDLVAHSRGSYNEARLLADLQAKGKDPVNSATFAHSDIDVGDFAHSLPDFCKGTQHLNVLYNPNDNALFWSAWETNGKAKLNDGCTVNDSDRLGTVGLRDQYLQNQAKDLASPGYFLSIKDDSSKIDPNGHTMTSKRVADILTNPKIYDSNENELKDGPKYKQLDPAACKVALTNPPVDTAQQAGPDQKANDQKTNDHKVNDQKANGQKATDSKATDTKPKPIELDPQQVQRDFVSNSPEVVASRTQRLASIKGEHWLPFDNIWASSSTQVVKQQ